MAFKIPIRKDLAYAVWGEAASGSKAFAMHILNLRRKLKPIGLGIRHLPPDGYCLIFN